ncbi:hypothetical protein ACM26V_09845 [Salipaludibacillus sp. HK11]|uniref:hypothetical protein n=1 Tax=Salipaludibacillus sp. HK11 TaxID=3394320 RepID=UPI0039FBFE28
MGHVWFGILFIGLSFFFALMSFMNLYPLWLTMPILFFSIVLTVQSFTNRHRFKGF